MSAGVRQRQPRIAAAVLACAVAAACSSSPPPPGPPPAPPSGEDDPDFQIERATTWLLVGNDLTPARDTIELQIFAPEGTETIDAWIDGGEGVRLVKTEDDFRQVIDGSTLAPGDHELLLAADGADTAFARRTIHRSHPLYVVLTTDWDDANNTDLQLSLQDNLHAAHPELRITHFVGPYTFTDPTVTEQRRGQLVDWLLANRDGHGDEIGLHIHPYCNFVDTTEVPCRTAPSVVYTMGDATGYTVMVSAYTEEEFTELLLAADELFLENGLNKPTSFRAGAWTAELHTLRALSNAGYVADTSALNWARVEEWQGVQNGVLYSWNKEHWSTIDDTSQPYYPSDSDILVPGEPSIDVLEVPDNGAMVDYVTADEMIEIFDANWNGDALLAPAAYTIGYHPPNFTTQYRDRILGALSHADSFLASRGQGPVVYATLSELVKVWPQVPAASN